MNPEKIQWELGRDRFGRRVTISFDAPHDFSIRIEPESQRDEGESIRNLSRPLILQAAEVLKDFKRATPYAGTPDGDGATVRVALPKFAAACLSGLIARQIVAVEQRLVAIGEAKAKREREAFADDYLTELRTCLLLIEKARNSA